MSLTYNRFKDTTIYGNFINDSSGAYIANALFKGNVKVTGNINLNSSNSNIYKYDGTLFVGQKGDQGIQGIQGIQGLKGDTGLQGVKGDTGLQGIQGVKGDTGLQGIQGVKGDTGLQGIQGV